MRPWTTYGVYTPDLKACCLSGLDDLEEAKRWCHGDRVVCEERIKTYGFAFAMKWLGGFRFMFRRWGWCVGPLKFDFERLTIKAADRIVWRREDEDGKA